MENDATGITLPGNTPKGVSRFSTDVQISPEDAIEEHNKRKELHFKASHGLLIGFFLWILYVVEYQQAFIVSNPYRCLHALGIYFFTKGFLLTRLVLEHKSECSIPPIKPSQQYFGTYEAGCWHPKTFDKAVVIIIDALRYDFTVPLNDFDVQPHHFHNALNVLHETAVHSPQNAFLLPFIADPPTATLQRLKGLTTGTLPAFIDAGSNFAGTAIEEDNLVTQLRDAGKTLVHLGDDTWHSLFPGHFDVNLTHAYDSFNVWDLHTVDNGVTEHLLPLLNPSNSSKWDVIFGHYLGVDHAGHRYGPDHQAMSAKLSQMDKVLREIIRQLDEETLLVVMGDHGMDTKGDHGGESDDEIEAALWMYSKKGIFGREHSGLDMPSRTAKERPVGQIDLVPTLSLLLGMPIPFNNLGAPIAEAFVGSGSPNWHNLASVNALTSAQIHRYQNGYSLARGLDDTVFSKPLALWDEAHGMWQQRSDPTRKTDDYQRLFLMFSNYQKETIRIYRSLWARFDVPSMVLGIATLLFALVILATYAGFTVGNRVEYTPAYLRRIGFFSIFGTFAGGAVAQIYLEASLLDGCLLGFGAGGMVGFVSVVFTIPRAYSFTVPKSVWSWLSIVLTLSQAIGFASNSYTIWEDEILLFFLATVASVALISSIRQADVTERVLGISQSSIFFLLTRLASLSRLCREEQMPYCKSTYYASSTSSTSAPWQLLIPLILAATLPSFIKGYYAGTRSYEGSAIFWIGFTLRMGLTASAIFWTLDAADDHDCFNLDKSTLRTIKITIAQLVLATAFAAGTATFYNAKPCISIEMISSAPKTPTNPQPTSATPQKKSVKVFGYANMHGSRFFLLTTNLLLAIILVQKPMGGGAIGILCLQILALCEIIDANDLSDSAIGPIALGLLGNFHFFKTGHQATLSSIQWEAAFIPLKSIHYPWSPLLIIFNTFGAQILTTASVPLIVLWKRPPKEPGLLSDVAKAVTINLLYYATINVATTMWAGWLRRHLMLYRIFNPRFMTGAAVLVVVDLVAVLVAVGGLRWNTWSVAEVVGWG